MVVMEVCRKFDALCAPMFEVFLVNCRKDVLSFALLRTFSSISRYPNTQVSEVTETKTETLL